MRLLNTTTITVDEQYLKVRVRPIALFNNKTISAQTIQRIYVKERIHRNSGSNSYSYAIKVTYLGGKDKTLVSFDSNVQAARYVARVMNAYMQKP